MSEPAPAIAAWLEPAQAPFVAAAARAGRFRIALAGSPVKGQSGLVAQHLDAQPFDDLRAMLAEAPPPLVWLAAAGDFGDDPDRHDARTVAAAAAKGVTIASTEPIPASCLNLSPGGWTAGSDAAIAGDRLRFVPLPRLSRPLREAHEVLASFGTPRFVQVECWGGTAEGSLAARLLGAVDLLVWLMGEPDTIHAAYVPPQGSLAPPGEHLRNLHGDISAMMRFPEGRAAVLAASSAAGRFGTIITLISPSGRLRFYDDGFEWIAPDGSRRDQQRLTGRGRGAPGLEDVGAAVTGEAIARLLDPAAPDPGPMALSQVLTLCQTALLSARTGNPESPEAIRRMMLV
jgi:hypothetical protein